MPDGKHQEWDEQFADRDLERQRVVGEDCFRREKRKADKSASCRYFRGCPRQFVLLDEDSAGEVEYPVAEPDEAQDIPETFIGNVGVQEHQHETTGEPEIPESPDSGGDERGNQHEEEQAADIPERNEYRIVRHVEAEDAKPVVGVCDINACSERPMRYDVRDDAQRNRGSDADERPEEERDDERGYAFENFLHSL